MQIKKLFVQGDDAVIVNNVGYNHCHDADFYIDRPNGSGDYLLLLLKTDTIFNIDGQDMIVPANSVFIYPKGRPQYYRCLPQHTFENDWLHFDFSTKEKEADFLGRKIPFETLIQMNLNFLSFCIKSIAYEKYSNHPYKDQSIRSYLFLMFIKIAEYVEQTEEYYSGGQYEILSTIRHKIYAEPYINRTVDWAAHEIRMSRSTFQHAYKKHFSVSYIQDFINSKISYSKMLLTSTNLTIDEIAKQCGYRSYVHYTRQFKEQVGISPTEYRNRNK